jgi:DNA-binding NarL/FixJ family response regulator
MNPHASAPPGSIRIALMCENPNVYRSLGPRLSADRAFVVVGTFDCVMDQVPDTVAADPDVVILGISRITHFNMMICQAVKQARCDALVIVLPSYVGDTDEVRSARAAGADTVILKSIDTPALVEQIHALLELKS